MSRIKLLKDIVEDMKALATSLNALTEVLESDASTTKNSPDKEEPKKSILTLYDVRAVLAKKLQAGLKNEIKELIQKYGAEKLSAVNPEHYEALLKDVEELGK